METDISTYNGSLHVLRTETIILLKCWIAQRVRSLATEPEVGSLIPPLGLLGEEPAWVALGQLHNPRAPPEEGNGKPHLCMLYLQNPKKEDCRLLEST